MTELEQLRIKNQQLCYALANTFAALSDFYICEGNNPSSGYNTVQILADALEALKATKFQEKAA